VIELDAADITPMVATPAKSWQRKICSRPEHAGPIEIAFGGTCTAGKK